jgi:hypothetical protein
MDARWPLIRGQETELARLGGPPLVFQGQVFQFHSQVASLGIHQESSWQGGQLGRCGCIPSLVADEHYAAYDDARTGNHP